MPKQEPTNDNVVNLTSLIDYHEEQAHKLLEAAGGSYRPTLREWTKEDEEDWQRLVAAISGGKPAR